MSNTLENQPQSPAVPSTTAAADDGPPPEIRRLLNDVFFAPIRAVVEAADITRQCHSLEDHTFAILCVNRPTAFSSAAAHLPVTQIPHPVRARNIFFSLQVAADGEVVLPPSSIHPMPYSLILTHPGSSHKDEFLACCVLLADHRVPIVRREPTAGELADPGVAVVDVGNQHAPEVGNFDHHQFPKDHPPACSLSLVLQNLGLYEDARAFCDWLEPAEWLDTRGPNETSRWLGIDRGTLAKLNSPIDVTLLRRFASVTRLEAGEPLWEIMRWTGEDLIGYLRSLRQRLDFIAEVSEFWEIPAESGAFQVCYVPRTEPLPDDPSSGIVRFIESHPSGTKVVGLVYPDRRGGGYGLSRHNDNPMLDFTRIGDCEDVHFAHARGFVAKTSATDSGRLKELLRLSWG